MRRRVVWLQLLLGWLPVWGLFTMLVLMAHGPIGLSRAMFLSLRSIIPAAALGLLVQKVTERFPWPEHVRVRFVAFHIVAALVYAIAWIACNSVIESIMLRQLVLVYGVGIGPFLVTGVWIYVMIAGVSYTVQSADRAAKAEASAAKAQLAALRSQLNPHFLFNALHTVVQLIPREPATAAMAAEQLAGLLRTTIEEDRDIVSVSEEIAFVERYLDIEIIRFGDRLRIHFDIPQDALAATMPSFAALTLVENAIRHGAAPMVEPTDLSISARLTGDNLLLSVKDTGAGIPVTPTASGTGLRRLRERLAVLYGSRASLELTSASPPGTLAVLRIPQERAD